MIWEPHVCESSFSYNLSKVLAIFFYFFFSFHNASHSSLALSKLNAVNPDTKGCAKSRTDMITLTTESSLPSLEHKFLLLSLRKDVFLQCDKSSLLQNFFFPVHDTERYFTAVLLGKPALFLRVMKLSPHYFGRPSPVLESGVCSCSLTTQLACEASGT